MASVSTRNVKANRVRPLTLRRNFSWTLAGNIVYAGCNWMMLIVLAKLGTTHIVGQYTLGVAVTQPIITFAMLHLRAVQATDARFERSFRDYMGLRLLMTVLALLLMACTAFRGGYSRETGLVILMTGIGTSFDAISDVIYGLFQQRERMDRIAVSMILKGPLSLLGLGAGLALTHSIVWAVAGSALASVAVVLLYDLPNCAALVHALHRDGGMPGAGETWLPRFHPATLWKLAWLALPLGVATALIPLNDSLPRFVITKYLGESALGIFAAPASFLKIGQVVVLSLGYPIQTRLAQYHTAERTGDFLRLLGKFLAISFAIGAGLFLVCLVGGQSLLSHLFKPEYARRQDVLLWLLAAGVVFYVSMGFGVGLTAARRFNVQLVWSALSALIALGASWALVPGYGLKGAAIAIFLSMLARLTIGAILMFQALRAQHGTQEETA